MKISYNWLRDYVDIKNSARQAAEWLTMAGLEVTSLEEKDKDSILEMEVTTNRPDWLSVIGVARELSAITGKRLMPPKVPLLLSPQVRNAQIKVEVEDKILCPRYTARVMEAVRVGPSPKWLIERLESIGVRPVNNVVDITNFCLFELGQPLHAFDYDKLAGNSIIVRKARKGEELVTIDNAKRQLTPDMLIIADEKKPIALAGIMGGIDTEATEATRTILIESAFFDPISVRKTQRRLVLSTESSYRFERSVDYDGVLFASNRAAGLIAEICGGKLGILKDAGIKVARTSIIKLSVKRINDILNLNLTPVAVKKILTSLGLKVSGAEEQLKVETASFRMDLKREEDLIEEVARIHGYDKIPETIPKIVGHTSRKSYSRKIEEITRDFLTGQGLDEALTYSLIDRKDLNNINFADDNRIVAISNPLSSQQEIMRPTLIPGLLNAACFNINRKTDDLRMFELSKVYTPSGEKGYKETLELCVIMSGEDATLFDIKGIAENLFERLGISGCEFIALSDAGIFYQGRSAKIILKSAAEIGVIGEIRSEILNNFGIKKAVFL
ncbi:MAG: phenylalanine--tRNA ligase subunit beta, partial [Candidatus Omnitrophica bacterium]|nr:phenylalanine--tRNA ligase subunit beta [Candidatus Omnitrophota bacterium]